MILWLHSPGSDRQFSSRFRIALLLGMYKEVNSKEHFDSLILSGTFRFWSEVTSGGFIVGSALAVSAVLSHRHHNVGASIHRDDDDACATTNKTPCCRALTAGRRSSIQHAHGSFWASDAEEARVLSCRRFYVSLGVVFVCPVWQPQQ